MVKSEKAVVLVSGGLDSATTLAIARQAGFECYALSFDYGQRHRCELEAAKEVTKQLGATSHKTITLGLDSIGGSALTDTTIAVPERAGEGIPVTYVPARNTVFLAFALGWAEVVQARAIFIGVNAVDYSGYPDCRPEFLQAFNRLAKLATRTTVEGNSIHIYAPLLYLSKQEIIQRGVALGVDYSLTVSCYNPDHLGKACGRCDSCRIRAAGFTQAGLKDPTIYHASVALPS